jgi:hypothetical protein
MNAELVSRFVDSIIYRAGRAGRVVARADDPRVQSGELLTDKQARAMITPDVRRALAGLEREMEHEIREAFAEGMRHYRECDLIGLPHDYEYGDHIHCMFCGKPRRMNNSEATL